MSLVQILKLVGFGTGAALYLYIAWLIWNRRRAYKTPPLKLSVLDIEVALITLGLCLGAWFLGNLLSTLQVLVSQQQYPSLLRIWDTITVIGIALLPSVLLQTHITLWSELGGLRLKPNQIKLLIPLLYLPMLVLPYTIYRLNTGAYRPFLQKLGPLLLPYSIWFLLALWLAAAIDWMVRDRLYRQAERERAFLGLLAAMLVVLGAFEFIVVGLLRLDLNDYLWVTYLLLSLLPPVTIAYYIYRYHPVQLVIKGSLVYATFAVIFITVYTYGVRYASEYMGSGDDRRRAAIEAILLLGMFALAGPLVRLIDKTVERLFAREISLYRDLARQVSVGASGFGEIDALVRYLEKMIGTGLELTGVKIFHYDQLSPEGPIRNLADKFSQRGTDLIEGDDDLASLGFTAAYPLRREGRLVGVMLVAGDPRALTSEKHAVLDVLVNQVAIELERCHLVEEKVRLERELAARERLAVLGQMAATVAHEVKNPLSSIKSIAQVMKEDEELKGYESDLRLIIGEIDRLNQTVSQLLSFSRPARDLGGGSAPVPLRELIDSTVALVAGDAAERLVRIVVNLEPGMTISSDRTSPLREALSNLVINAVQASPSKGVVTVQAEVSYSGRAKDGGKLTLSVTDEGPGISEDAKHRVFEPFFTTKPRGTGLGLAIVQRRTAEMGGTVELTSPVSGGAGTRFSVILPAYSRSH